MSRSPGIVVTVAALAAALAGTAVAGPDASTSAINKKRVKKIATKQIRTLAPGLSVASADTATTAVSAETADTANTANAAESADTATNAANATSAETVDGHSIHRFSTLVPPDGTTETVEMGLGYSLSVRCAGGSVDIRIASADGNPPAILRSRAATGAGTRSLQGTPLAGGDAFAATTNASATDTDGNLEIAIWRQDGTGVTAEAGYADNATPPFGEDACALGGKSLAG
ncbi:MAG: hypothetical protein ACRDL3_14540 [Solirubrobacterales bacterium]